MPMNSIAALREGRGGEGGWGGDYMRECAVWVRGRVCITAYLPLKIDVHVFFSRASGINCSSARIPAGQIAVSLSRFWANALSQDDGHLILLELRHYNAESSSETRGAPQEL